MGGLGSKLLIISFPSPSLLEFLRMGLEGVLSMAPWEMSREELIHSG